MSNIRGGRSALLLCTIMTGAACSEGSPVPTNPEIVESILITPGPSEIAFGDNVVLQAVALGRDGQPVSRPVTWSSSDQSVATVNAVGRVQPVRVGAARITARIDNVAASVDVEVPVPEGILGTLTLFKANNRPLPAVVFAEQIPGLGFVEVVATTGWLEIDSSGRYMQQVWHESRIDGVLTGILKPIDRGSCEITATALACASDLVLNQRFTANYSYGGVRTSQDYANEPTFPLLASYDFAQVHIE